MAADLANVIRDILANNPRTIWFPLGETAEQRAATISGLPSEAQEVMLKAMREVILEGYEEVVQDYSLEDLMAVDAPLDEQEFRQCSDDWRLRIFEGEAGRFYDFNGWPGDNERGAGYFYPREGEPVLVFTNGDCDLVTDLPELKEVVEEYMEWRELHDGPEE